MYAVILKRSDHFQTGAIADVCEARIPVTAKIPLENISLASPVKNGAPRLQFANAGGGFFRVEFGHTPVVEVLSSAHRVCEVNFPIIGGIDCAQRCSNAAFGHHGVGFSKKGLANQTDCYSCRRCF